MLVMLIIGWTVVLPALVVSGLYLGSMVLGRRRRREPLSAAIATAEIAAFATRGRTERAGKTKPVGSAASVGY